MKKVFFKSALCLLILIILCVGSFAMPKSLIPGGNTVGIKLYADGLMISQVEDGLPAQKVGLRIGDSIMAVNNIEHPSVKDLLGALQGGKRAILRVKRGEKTAQFLVSPQYRDGAYRIGLRVRDGISGIGTVTYYDPQKNCFGALGHGVSAQSDGTVLPLSSGFLVSSSVAEIHKGCVGTPGELKGAFDVSRSIGNVLKNNGCGIFGTVSSLPVRAAVPLGQGHTGKAVIRSNIDGTEIGQFQVQIERITEGEKNGRELFLRVTDEELLKKTGGIVQGMSGSPILQDGKLIGAVTHVLISDPKCGYGISIERMLDAA